MTSAPVKWPALLLGWLVMLSIPIALIGTSLRAILVPAFLQIEYGMPNFPPDPYGFEKQDRLRWAAAAWSYLVDPGDDASLADLRFDDGSPAFNPREVSHMADVKAVVRAALMAWYVAIVILGAAGIFLWRRGQLMEYVGSVRRGGFLTVALAGFIGVIVAVGMLADPRVFWDFFTMFHGLFFKGDSWLFAYSDTLIRLFPIRFWQDTFLIAALIVLGGGLLLGFGLKAPARETRARI